MIINGENCSKYISLPICIKKLFFHELILVLLCKICRILLKFYENHGKEELHILSRTISLTNIFEILCNVNMLIMVTTCIIVHDVLVFYALRSPRKLIKLF